MGQWPDSVLFRASSGEAVAWIMKDGIFFQYSRRIEEAKKAHDSSATTGSSFDREEGIRFSQDSIETAMIKTEFVGASLDADVVGLDEIDYKCNYFLGNSPEKWRRDVPNFAAVRMNGIYPGVDAVFEYSSDQLDLQLEGAGDAWSQVKIRYLGAPVIETGAGTVILQTRFGEMKFRNGLPLEEINAFSRSNAPIGNMSSALSLTYSTYLGGSGQEYGTCIAVDGAGSAYVTGQTSSSDFPTVNPLDGTFNSGGVDAFVTKLSPAGNTLVYSTYLGGSTGDAGNGIAVDGAGSAYVTGISTSSDFPTANPFDGGYSGNYDAFVTKLSPAGSTLVYSTYLGNSGIDQGYGISVDAAGSAYVTGYTSSSFPTVNPFDGTFNGGIYEAFVTKLSPAGNTLVYSTYLGGNGDEVGFGIAVDGAGWAYVTGSTNSSDFPTANPFDGSFNGNNDAFVTKLSSAGNTLDFSTYLGGNGDEVGSGIALDREGRAYVTGSTNSSDFPAAIPFDGSFNGNNDAFVTKLSSAGSTLDFSTYLGGNGDEVGFGIALDREGRAYVTGVTNSSDFPTANPFDGSLNSVDAFVTRLSPAGNALDFSTYLGGSLVEEISNIAVDRNGSAYVMGYTYSSDFPLQSEFQTDQTGLDVFVTKFNPFESQCCLQTTGDVDCDALDKVDIADLTTLIDHLFLNNLPLCCPTEANINASPDGRSDIADLTLLIDHLFILNPSLPDCQ